MLFLRRFGFIYSCALGKLHFSESFTLYPRGALSMNLALFEGFFISIGLIMAIGAQNAFIISQGVTGQYNFTIALTSSLCDVLLMSIGVLGVGAVISQHPLMLAIATWGGALFLGYYGVLSLRSALTSRAMTTDDRAATSFKKVLITGIAMSLLNPHAYLDTVVLIGGVSSKFAEPDKLIFLCGSLLASFLWFFGLSFGARKLKPLFEKPLAWRILDTLVTLMMWGIAVSLVIFGLQS